MKLTRGPGKSPEPFLKYAGGKRQLLPEIRKHVPERFGRYYEPFVGGGAVFFDLYAAGRIGIVSDSRAVLNDCNMELMTTYEVVRDDLESLIVALKRYAAAHSEKHYYATRARIINEPELKTTAAARMIYLNKTCFNGLYRVNKRGEFNVPIGRYANPTICDEPNLRVCSRALQCARLLSTDFASATAEARRGDFVFCDPPYWPAGEFANFTAYTKSGFTAEDHRRLRDCLLELKSRGVRIMLTNADVPPVRDLYSKGFEKVAVSARRNINSKAGKRGTVGEILIW